MSKLAELKKRRWARALIVITASVWGVVGITLAVTFYLLMAVVWLIGCPIAKAIRYIHYGDTKTQFFDDLEDALNFL